MRTRLCHITSAHNRDDPRIFHKECVSLAKYGCYEVFLLVNDDEPDELKQGVRIVTTGLKPKSRKERFLDSKKILLQKAIEINAEIYQLHDPDLLPLGNKLKKIGKIVIFDSHEDIPQQILDKYWIPKYLRNIISKIFEEYEKYSISKYDGVISVTPKVVQRLRKINSNSIMITNYPIVDEKQVIERKPEKAICFAGGICKEWNHINILKAIKDIVEIRYILAGRSSDSYIERLKSMDAWGKVDYRGQITFKEVKDIYNVSMAGMALNYSIQAREEGTLGNTKLFEYMEAKLPVICSNYRLWKEIIEGNKCGICVDPKNIKEIENAIRYIIDNPEEAMIMGENGRRAVIEKYNWGTQEKILVKFYKN